MRSLFLAAFLFVSVLATFGRAVPADPVLTDGLQTCLSNGVDAGVRRWYAERPELGGEMALKVVAESSRLGAAIDTEIVAVQQVSKRVTRFYLAIYFMRSPLWIRIERYENGEKSFFMPLKCSHNPDDILPGYVTEFLR